MRERIKVTGTYYRKIPLIDYLRATIDVIRCDVAHANQVSAAVEAAKPDVVFHLAAQSLPEISWKNVRATFRTNFLGTLNVLEAVHLTAPEATVVIAGSSAEYGPTRENEPPLGEEASINPTSPYGASKAAADVIARFYGDVLATKVLRVRLFHAVGPRKTHDMCSDFARGIVAVERGLRSSMRVGNLDAVRDFVDVVDAVHACQLVAERGTAGQVYNICSGVGHSVQQILDILLSKARSPIHVERDRGRLRPGDQSAIIGDNTRLRGLGWELTVPIEQTLQTILDYWRNQDTL